MNTTEAGAQQRAVVPQSKAAIIDQLTRRNVSVLRRALLLVELRQLWEARHVPIRRGRPCRLVSPVGRRRKDGSPAQVRPFFDMVTAETGMSRRAVERMLYIGMGLKEDAIPSLLRSRIADNQRDLYRLASEHRKSKSQAATFDPSGPWWS